MGVLGSSVESISIAQRAAWLRDMFCGDRHVRIVCEPDDVPVDYNSPAIWAAHVAIMRQAVQAADREYGKAAAIDAVFTSEQYGAELVRHFGVAHVCLDSVRTLYPVSGTAARASPAAHWDLLPPAVRAGMALRVVVPGAESTGTSTLARHLSDALRQRGGPWARTAWVAEYGREYSHNLLALMRARKPAATAEDIAWQSDDFAIIAAEQCRLEQEAARHGGPVLLCDTDAFATRIWHERYMGQPSAQVARLAGAMPARALYLLTNDAGVPFENDGLRDGAHLRGWMTRRFRAVLGEQGVPWLEIEGAPDVRLRIALAAVDATLEKAWQFAAPLEQRDPAELHQAAGVQHKTA